MDHAPPEADHDITFVLCFAAALVRVVSWMNDGNHLVYRPFEPLSVPRPVDRITYLRNQCRGLRVLDVGAFDETKVVNVVFLIPVQFLFPLTAFGLILDGVLKKPSADERKSDGGSL